MKTEEEKTLIDEAAYVKIENEKKKEGYTAASLEELEKAGWVRNHGKTNLLVMEFNPTTSLKRTMAFAMPEA